jgi:hypothetical protein
MNTEFETKNETATTGDYIVINNPDNMMERYVVKQAKFNELYDMKYPLVAANATLYQTKDTVVRKCVIVTKEIAEYLKDIGLAPIASQQEMLNVFKNLKQYNCRKNSTVLAWQWTQEDGVVETHVIKSNNTHVIDFIAPWRAKMPLKVGDAVIVMQDECYRIAEQEFARTYEILTELG